VGRNAAGQSGRAGGWGHHLDDCGSGYALGQAAIVAATRAADGRGEPTALATMVLQGFGLDDLSGIYRALHEEVGVRTRIAALAREVVVRADTGDAVARRIVADGTAGLVEMVVTVARRLGLTAPELALTGGLVENAVSYRHEFLTRLQVALPGFQLVTQGLSPVAGSVLLAAGGQVSGEFLDNLRRTAPKTWSAR